MAPYRYGRIMVTGKYSDGKTSLIQALLGKPIPKKHIPTDGLDARYSCKVDITRCTEEWSELFIEKKSMVDDGLTAAILLHADTEEATEATVITEEANVHGDNSVGVNQPNLSFPREREQMPERHKITDTEKVQMKDTMPESAELFKDDDKQLYDKVNKTKDKTQENKAVIFMWDYGGQDVYTNLHPIFLRTDCVYIVVFDLQKLENAQQNDELKNYADQFEFWLQMIQSNCPEIINAKQVKNVLLVGTHKDKVKGFTSKRREKQSLKLVEDLNDKLEGKKYKDLVTGYFQVDSKAGVNGDSESFKHLKQCLIKSIHDSKTWGEMRPVPYMRLLGKLYEQEGKPEHAIMSIKDINQYAAAYNIMSEEGVHQFLMFHHATGDLTYFPDMKDFVIVNAQWLIDVFTRVITIDEYQGKRDVVNHGELDRLRKEGLIKKDGPLFADLWRDLVGDDEAHIDHLKHLMCKFDLMMEHGDHFYMIPCLLKKGDDVEQPNPACPTIYLQFHASQSSQEDFHGNIDKMYDHFLPSALFHQLICRIAGSRDTGWRRNSDNSQRDIFEFTAGDQVISVAMKSTWIRLSLNDDTSASGILSKLRTHLDSLLKERYCNMWYEFYVNPCHGNPEGSEECIRSTGYSSLGGKQHMTKCKTHQNQTLKTADYNFWFGE